MLKAGISYLLKPVTKLFNLIFTNFSLPDVWRKSSLTPIHKKGDCFIPSYHRGIAIVSLPGIMRRKSAILLLRY